MTIKDKKTNKLLLNAFDYDFDLWWKDVASGVYGVDVTDWKESDNYSSDFWEDIDSAGCCKINLLHMYLSHRDGEIDPEGYNKDIPPDLLDELNDAIETLDAIRDKAGGRLPKEEGPEVKKWRELHFRVNAIRTINSILPALDPVLIYVLATEACTKDDFDHNWEQFMFYEEAKKVLDKKSLKELENLEESI